MLGGKRNGSWIDWWLSRNLANRSSGERGHDGDGLALGATDAFADELGRVSEPGAARRAGERRGDRTLSRRGCWSGLCRRPGNSLRGQTRVRPPDRSRRRPCRRYRRRFVRRHAHGLQRQRLDVLVGPLRRLAVQRALRIIALISDHFSNMRHQRGQGLASAPVVSNADGVRGDVGVEHGRQHPALRRDPWVVAEARSRPGANRPRAAPHPSA